MKHLILGDHVVNPTRLVAALHQPAKPGGVASITLHIDEGTEDNALAAVKLTAGVPEALTALSGAAEMVVDGDSNGWTWAVNREALVRLTVGDKPEAIFSKASGVRVSMGLESAQARTLARRLAAGPGVKLA